MRFEVTIETREDLTDKVNILLLLGREQGHSRSFKYRELWRETMRYQVILEFDEDWTIDEIERLLHEANIDFHCDVIDVEKMESVDETEMEGM